MVDDPNPQEWSIDADSLTDWPEQANELEKFRQGSLIDHPPFAYHANSLVPLWGVTSRDPEPAADSLIEVGHDDRPPFGMIVTQSCDIYGKGSNRKPWVQVVPAYRLPDADVRWGQARDWKIRYMVPIASLGDRWIADLRIEIPIEKSWLLGREPTGAVEDALQLEEHLRNYRGRFALADSIHDFLLTPLGEWMRNLHVDHSAEFAASVSDAFLAVGGDALMNPTVVQLILVCRTPLSEALSQSLDNWWDGLGADRPWELLANRLVGGDDSIPLSEQRAWYSLDLAAVADS